MYNDELPTTMEEVKALRERLLEREHTIAAEERLKFAMETFKVLVARLEDKEFSRVICSSRDGQDLAITLGRVAEDVVHVLKFKVQPRTYW